MDSNSSVPPISNATEEALSSYYTVSGATCLLLNILIGFLIFLDDDEKHPAFRRYLMSLQFFSTVADGLLSIVSPVFVASQWTLYTLVKLPFDTPLLIAMIAYVVFFCEIIVSFAACLFYCHQMLLPPQSRLRLGLIPLNLCLLVLNAWLIVYVVVFYIVFNQEALTAEALPSRLEWLSTKASFLYAPWNESTSLIASLFFAFSIPVYVVFFLLIVHIVYIVKKGMEHASEDVQAENRRAVVSIGLQAVIPGLSLVLPIGIHLIGAATMQLPLGDDLGAWATAFVNLHGVLNSLTLIIRSQKFGKPIVALIVRCRGGGERKSSKPMVSKGRKERVQAFATTDEGRERIAAERFAKIMLE